jgi:hypothetical protein
MKNKKLILGLLVAGAVGFYFYNKSKNKSKGATSSFDGDGDFFNFGETPPKKRETGIIQAGTRSGESIGASYCEVVSGNVGYAGMSLSNNRVIVRTGNGTTLICPRGQRYDLPR